MGTNEPYHVFDGFIPENRFISVGLNDSFPPIPEHIDIVFVPIYNEVKPIKAGLSTLAEVMRINPNVAVIATKLTKREGTTVLNTGRIVKNFAIFKMPFTAK